MKKEYQTTGVCAKQIDYEIKNGKVYNIKFHGGCPGNLQMLSKILNGWEIDKVIEMCKGNTCGFKNTSCADQLANALEKEKISV